MERIKIDSANWEAAKAAIEAAKPKGKVTYSGPGPHPEPKAKPYTKYDDSTCQIWADVFVIATLKADAIPFTQLLSFDEWKKRVGNINSLLTSADNTSIAIPDSEFFAENRQLIDDYIATASPALFDLFKVSSESWLDERESPEKSTPREKALLLLKP